MRAESWTDIVQANASNNGGIVVGIDPYLPDIPAAFEREGSGTDWLPRYLDFVLDTTIGRVGFVKFQSAYFEAYGLAGLNALSLAMKRARSAGLGVILDAKRGDIGSTAAAYARAYLTPGSAGGSGDFEADCLTVNPMMGPDTLEPFLDCVRRFGKGLFVLCRTSNPGAGWLQDRMAGNRFISDRLADLIATVGKDCFQGGRLNPVGAVIGATVPQEGKRLRSLLPNAIILAPGLGPQGGDAAALDALRGSQLGDLLVPVSRGLLRADDRSITLDEYERLIEERLHLFKTMIAAPSNLSATG
ncbi:orotidine-5'-phosphate decarboxylase [Bradyrhizobium sp. Gha]|uniref:orotidine-5'-phosphate decarboxylase n=1 Tax=Bradyrhizobium sp. Gha TaxID=1855318 RepID=UPI0008E66092|nr:orotidine-5'-phosphate decarboxylase [Bradyrhizobium sp. Gha]SFI52650.1 orotidine-5'-phosphate decarboxylase [Bradyrhizobium sp. Gha]